MRVLVEVGDGSGVRDLAEMNRLFQSWLETVYHQGVHSETGEAPSARWARAAPAERAVQDPDPGRLREAFLWSQGRRAAKTALVSLHGNSYQVDAWLARRYVELVFDPFDLGHVEVRADGKPAGTPVPFTVGRHRHPKAAPSRPPRRRWRSPGPRRRAVRLRPVPCPAPRPRRLRRGSPGRGRADRGGRLRERDPA